MVPLLLRNFSQLTTIRQPIDEIASLIVDILLKKLKAKRQIRIIFYQSQYFLEEVFNVKLIFNVYKIR